MECLIHVEVPELADNVRKVAFLHPLCCSVRASRTSDQRVFYGKYQITLDVPRKQRRDGVGGFGH